MKATPVIRLVTAALPLVVGATVVFPPTLVGQTSDENAAGARVAQSTSTSQSPVIDGRLDDEAWAAAPVISDFVQHEPFEGRPATERSEVRFLYDARAVYIGASLYDRDPTGIVVGETRRDASLDDTDAFLIVLDTYLDRQNGFVFGTTPAGIEYDGQVTKEGEGGFSGAGRQQRGSGGGLNLNWDGSWTVATSVDSRGWYAEFRIPFSTLRYGSGGSQLWGMNIARHVRRKNEQDFWAPIPRQYTLYRVSQAGTLQGIQAPARRTMSVTPYALSSTHRDFAATTDTDFDGEIGGDAKIGLTPSLTLDVTYNTDFAQVEVDEQQINLTRFNLFFPEKRPFFLENAGTFSVGTPQEAELFFSRRIGIDEDGGAVPILGGGRLSGKIGGLSLGLLDIQTEDVEASSTPHNNYAVGRVVQELPNRSRVGGLFVTRASTDQGGDYNLTYSIDGRMGIGDELTFDGYAAGTHTPGLDGREHAVSLSGEYSSREWDLGLAFREIGEDFNPEVGFLTRTAYRFASARILRRVRFPDVAWFRELRPHITYREYWDLDGFTETRVVHIDSHFEFSNGAFFQFPGINLEREGLQEAFEIADGVLIPPGTYDNVRIGYRFNTNESAPLSISGTFDIGGFYEGRRIGGDATVSARVGATFVAGLRLSYFDVNLPQGDFETALLGLRVAYSFTPRIYLQSLIQYNDQSDTFSSNVRFGWLSTAGTGLFLVYNDIEQTSTDWAPMDRAFIVKFTKQFNVLR